MQVLAALLAERKEGVGAHPVQRACETGLGDALLLVHDVEELAEAIVRLLGMVRLVGELEGDLEEMPAVVDALVGVIEVLPVLLVGAGDADEVAGKRRVDAEALHDGLDCADAVDFDHGTVECGEEGERVDVDAFVVAGYLGEHAQDLASVVLARE